MWHVSPLGAHSVGSGMGVRMIGLDRVARAINNMILNTRQAGMTFRLIGQEMRRDTMDHLESEEDSTGRGWPDLSPVTIAARRNKDKGSIKMLQDMGDLKSSISVASGASFAAVGTNKVYGPVHQFGSRRIPKREFLYITERNKRHYVEILTNATIRKALQDAKV